MKKLTTLSILFISLAFVVPMQASAATSAGVKPGSFFYFFDTTSESISLFFTFNPEQKAKKALEYADERLAEIEAIAEEKNPGAVKTAIANYESNVALATEKSKEVKDKGQAESLLTSIADNASRNQEVLSAVLIKVPEEAKAAIMQAIEASKKGQEEATKQIAELNGEIEKLKNEVAELKKQQTAQTKATEEIKKQKSEPSVSETTKTTKPVMAPQSQAPTKTEEIVVPVAKNFKDPVLSSINAQIESYKAITKWIDSDMMPLLSERESMLNYLISTTNEQIVGETTSSVIDGYNAFIKAYNFDLTNIVNFYRNDMFSEIKKHINNEKISALNIEYAKFFAKPSVSETEYNMEIQLLAQYQSDWQSIYDTAKLVTTKYMSQTDERDALYKRLLTSFSATVSDLKKTQALQSSLSQLYSQQIKPLNCTFSSHYNGFSTVGSMNCY